jgi:hypothetical protein
MEDGQLGKSKLVRYFSALNFGALFLCGERKRYYQVLLEQTAFEPL